jgi:ATP-dependent DNA helicase DinG
MARIGVDGVEPQRVCSHLLQSPFPYREQVLLGIPRDAPLPDSEQEYQQFTSDFIADALTISEGKGLVLFTSYRMLEQTYQDVFPKLEKLQITALKQGSEDRGRLLQGFIRDTASVLFATTSFWEGIDVPGEALKVVVICRLPFKVPTGPIFQARLEAIEKRGGNSFFDLALPEAVMRLKQGFGRLMRRHSDRGVVLILDGRVISKSYGKFFLESLPQTAQSIKRGEYVLQDIESFLYPVK